MTRLKDRVASWFGVASCVEPADRAGAERAIGAIYSLMGIPHPEFVWVASPAAAVEAAAVLDALGRESLLEVSDELLDWRIASRNHLAAQPGGAVISAGLEIAVQDLDSTLESLWNLAVPPDVPDRHFLDRCERGQLDASWLAFVDCARNEKGIEYPDHVARWLVHWEEVARCAGPWWPHRGVCIVSDRPSRLVWQQGEEILPTRLHATDGPALAFRDGFVVHAIRGIAVPAGVVERPAELSLQDIEEERNVEVRRIMIERYGTERWVREAGAHLIHQDRFGALYRRDMPHGDDPVVAVRVLDATPAADGSRREYFLRVPPWVATARAAVAWTFGLAAEDYDPAVES